MAATILALGQPGYIDRHGVGQDALDKTIDKLILRENMTLLQGAQFFRTVNAPKGDEYKESDFGNDLPLPPENEDTDSLPFATPTRGYSKAITWVTCRLGVQVERSLVEDEIEAVAKKMMSGLLRSGKLRIEYLLADYMNNLTTDSAAYRGGDNLPAVSDSHPYERRMTGTWDNNETAAALTSSTFFTMKTNLRKRTDTRGYKSPRMAKLLVVPADLAKKASEIATANLVPESAMNTPHTAEGGKGVSYVVYDYWTDTNCWAMFTNLGNDEENGLIFVQKVAPSVAPTVGSDRSTDVIWGQRLRMRVGAGLRHGKMLNFNAGA